MMLGAFPMLLSATENKEPEKICLNKGWEFSQVGKNEWLPATVPGTVHQDLMDNDKLINPFYGMNEEKVQWVEKEDWQYKTTFTLTKEQLARQAAVLRFEGLDTPQTYCPYVQATSRSSKCPHRCPTLRNEAQPPDGPTAPWSV